MVTSPAGGALPAGKRALSEIIEREEGRRRQRRRWWWAGLALVPLLVLGAWLGLRPKPIPLPARFRVETVTVGDVVREVHATGHVEAVTTVQVGAEISGRIASVEVDYNDVVKAGQVLAHFDQSALQAQLAQTKATRAAAKAGLEQARTDSEQAERTAARARRLHAEALISEAELETADANARVAKQRLEAADAQVAAQEAAYSLARTNRDYTVVKSPIDGIVITRNVDPGQTVASALQTPVLFSVAADLRKMRVIAQVDEADIGEVKVGQKASFGVNAFPDRVFEGQVTEVRNAAVVVQDVVTYGTVIAVDNLDLSLRPGMTASVRVRTALARQALRLPNSALHFSPPGERVADGKSVWTLTSGGLDRIGVEPGITDGEVTEVAPGPLRRGMTLLVELTPAGRKAYGIGH